MLLHNNLKVLVFIYIENMNSLGFPPCKVCVCMSMYALLQVQSSHWSHGRMVCTVLPT